MASPDPFTFTDLTNQPREYFVLSNAIVLTGTGGPFTVTISCTFGAGYWRKNGGSWSTSNGTAVLGDTIEVGTWSSAAFATAISVTFSVDAASDVFTITTEAEDTTPDAFVFNDVTGVNPSQLVGSNNITVSGMNSTATVTVTDGSYSKNDAAYTTSPGVAVNGDRFSILVQASSSYSTVTSGTLTIGGTSDTFSVTTRAADTTPNAYSFTDLTGQTTSTLVESGGVVLSGFEVALNINFSNLANGTVVSPATNAYEYKINSGSWLNATGTPSINPGDTLTLRMGTNGSGSVTSTMRTTIGGVSDTWAATTAADVLPDSFSFSEITNVIPGSKETQYTSGEAQITGISAQCTASAPYCDVAADPATPISSGYADPQSAVDNNDYIEAQTKVGAPIPGCGQQTLAITVSVGSGSAVWNIKTKPGMPSGQVTC